jgi:hypothetical protein
MFYKKGAEHFASSSTLPPLPAPVNQQESEALGKQVADAQKKRQVVHAGSKTEATNLTSTVSVFGAQNGIMVSSIKEDIFFTF